MKAIVNIEDIIEPTIGQLYNVKHIVIKEEYHNLYSSSDDIELVTVPIIGDKHHDRDLFTFDDHYHIDSRFTDLYDFYDDGFHGVPVWHRHTTGEIITQAAKCIKTMTGLPIERIKIGTHVHKRYKQWLSNMLGKSCKGKLCPHHGTLMLEREGYLYCPLHGLWGDKTTERIINPIKNVLQNNT